MTNFRAVIVSDSNVAVVLWRAWRDSNPRHLVPKTSALSAELQAHGMFIGTELYQIGEKLVGKYGYRYRRLRNFATLSRCFLNCFSSESGDFGHLYYDRYSQSIWVSIKFGLNGFLQNLVSYFSGVIYSHISVKSPGFS